MAWQRPSEGLLLIARGATLRVSGRVALLVGTVLTAVNQGSVVVAGDGDAALVLRTAANYLTPFLVSSVSLLLPYRRVTDAAVLPDQDEAAVIPDQAAA